MNDGCCFSFMYNVASMAHIYLFYEHYKTFTSYMSTKRYFSLCMLSHYLFFGFTFLWTVVSEMLEYQLWFDICPSAAGVLKAERHSINPMKNMFTGKQNVINPTIYQVFDRKQKPAGISLTSVSCDANGQKSWNHSLERQRGMERERESNSQGGSN